MALLASGNSTGVGASGFKLLPFSNVGIPLKHLGKGKASALAHSDEPTCGSPLVARLCMQHPSRCAAWDHLSLMLCCCEQQGRHWIWLIWHASHLHAGLGH